MVFDNADVSHRYLTPESPEPVKTPIADDRLKSAAQPQKTSQIKHAGGQSGFLTPKIEPLSGSQRERLQAVVVPATLTPAQRAEYQYMSERDSLTEPEQATASKPDAHRSLSIDQRQKGDDAVQSLETLLSRIFEAEDRLQPDTSGAAAVNETPIFVIRETDDGSVPMLQHDMQVRLDSTIQKVISIGRLLDVEVSRLTRVQKICESAVTAEESTNLIVGEDWSEQDGQEWSWKILGAERGLIAARTLLRTMGEGAGSKELQSEDYLRAILTALRNVIETCIVPLAEEQASVREKVRGEADPLQNSKFLVAAAYRKTIQTLLHAATKCISTLGDFLTKSDVDESALSSVEYMCKLLIFAENASNERDSLLGTQNFESTRRCAMDLLAKIFVKYTEQRQFILDEILISLEKLPASKQSARQYRLPDAKPIQLVSALLMRLVQSSASQSSETLGIKGEYIHENEAEDSSTEDESDEDDEDDMETSAKKRPDVPENLITIAKPLHDAAQSHATYIATTLVKRALTTSKSSDEPYRKLLDIFTDDFINVLGSADWPSAEMLLRALVRRMIGFAEDPKSAANSRTLALELLGTIGSGLVGLQTSARSVAKTSDMGEGSISRRLLDEVDQLEAGDMELSSLVAFDGPYRMVIEYLQARDNNDAQLRSAQGYHLMQWAYNLCGGREGSTDTSSSDSPRLLGDLQRKLRNMILDPRWLEEHHDYPAISTPQGRLAAMVVTLNSQLCKAFNRIFNILLTSMSSEHPTVRSRSLKSIVVLLQKDPSILDRNAYVLTHISRCLRDASPLVRESALRLVADCIKTRPALQSTIYDRVIERTRDAAIGVRKQSLRMLKDIYLRNDTMSVRAAIADAVITRLEDSEESVTELARQIMEEIWFVPLHELRLDGDRGVDAKLRFGRQTTLLIRTLEIGDTVAKVLETLIRNFTTQSKLAGAHSNVCKTLMQLLFDGIIDNSELPDSPAQQSILKCLTVFAEASPQLITAAQLERLEPYTKNLSKSDDLEVYRSAVTILRHVLPHHTVLRQDFLREMQTSLLTSVARLPRGELAEVVPCLWTINKLLGDIERLVKFVASALTNIYASRDINYVAEPQKVVKTSKLMLIAGQFGNACDFEAQIASFKVQFPWFKGNSVAGLIVEILCPFTSPKRPSALREVALEAVCTVSQAWPRLYLRADVVNTFETVFKDCIPILEEVLLTGLEAFFCAQETSPGVENVPALGSGVVSGTERLGRTYVATDQDGASTSLAQRFLQHFLRIALSSCDDIAYTAAKLIISINRQGHVHPKEIGPALVALETCPSNTIAHQAFVEHKMLHSKHETLLDKEYMRAVQQAFDYQRGTVGSTTGYTGRPPIAKFHLLWEVLKAGKAQVRKKFLANFSHKMDFSIAALDTTAVMPPHLEFVRFCCENLAFLEYHSVEELQHLLMSLEKIFSGTGTVIAQAIENDVLRLQVDAVAGSDMVVDGGAGVVPSEPAAISAEPARLRRLAVASQICSLVWETRSFVRRLWNMQKYLSNPKHAAKETNKAPNRATTAPALTDAYLKHIGEITSAALDQGAQFAVCRSFVDLMSTDSEVKVASEGEENGEAVGDGYETASEAATSRKSPISPSTSVGGRGRKRKSLSASNTPRKRGRPRKSPSAKLVDEAEDEAEWV